MLDHVRDCLERIFPSRFTEPTPAVTFFRGGASSHHTMLPKPPLVRGGGFRQKAKDGGVVIHRYKIFCVEKHVFSTVSPSVLAYARTAPSSGGALGHGAILYLIRRAHGLPPPGKASRLPSYGSAHGDDIGQITGKALLT